MKHLVIMEVETDGDAERVDVGLQDALDLFPGECRWRVVKPLTDDERESLDLAIGVGYRELANGDPGPCLRAAERLGLTPTDWTGRVEIPEWEREDYDPDAD